MPTKTTRTAAKKPGSARRTREEQGNGPQRASARWLNEIVVRKCHTTSTGKYEHEDDVIDDELLEHFNFRNS